MQKIYSKTDILRLSKVNDKERILNVTYKGTFIRVSADFVGETPQDEREWNDFLKILKDNNCQPRILYSPRLNFRCVCMCVCVCVCEISCCLTLYNPMDWTAAHQTPLSLGCPRQGYWSGLPFPPPGYLLDPGIELLSPESSVLQVDSLSLS